MTASPPAKSRVLLVSDRPQIFAPVSDEVAACGIALSGATPDRALSLDPAGFDLAVIDTDASADTHRRFRHSFDRYPALSVLKVYAPYAASKIVVAASSQSEARPIDLAAYCRRIGHEGPLTPTLDTLRALHERHVAAIPFEAIDVLLDRPIDLSPEAIDAKLITARRGGYCYEQNGLFKRVLQAIGFDVDGQIGSVRWGEVPGAPPPPATHMVLRVTIDDVPWMVDVGFGSSVPPAPLRLDTTADQPTRHESYRILPLGARQRVQAEFDGRWQTLYDILPEPLLDSHHELFNWFTSTHPSSHFRQQLIVTRVAPEARYALLGRRLTRRDAKGGIERRYLERDEIERVLTELFHLKPEPGWRPIIDRAADSPPPQQSAPSGR